MPANVNREDGSMGGIAANPNESEPGAIPTSTESADLSLQKEEAPGGRYRSEMEQLFRANDTRKFYEKVNRTREGYVPRADMCRDVEGNLLMEESEVINRWRQYFNEHLNGDEVKRDGIGVELGEPAADNTFPSPELQEIQQGLGS